MSKDHSHGSPSGLEGPQFETSPSLPVLRWPRIESTGAASAVVTNRRGGVSKGPYESLNLGLHVGDDPVAVIENRSRAAAFIGLELDDLVFCRQTHSSNVARVGPGDRGRGAREQVDALADTDALVTADPSVGLVIMVADCVPVMLVDPVARVLACVHAGWRGATSRIAAVAVEEMVDMGASRGRILVGLGPAVSAERYQVGEDVLSAASDAFGSRAGEVIQPDGSGRWTFDGWAANLLALGDAGVPRDNVSLAGIDTLAGGYFSDRAERPCGRFALLAKLLP